jgi:hypothetical protein
MGKGNCVFTWIRSTSYSTSSNTPQSCQKKKQDSFAKIYFFRASFEFHPKFETIKQLRKSPHTDTDTQTKGRYPSVSRVLKKRKKNEGNKELYRTKVLSIQCNECKFGVGSMGEGHIQHNHSVCPCSFRLQFIVVYLYIF